MRLYSCNKYNFIHPEGNLCAPVSQNYSNILIKIRSVMQNAKITAKQDIKNKIRLIQ